MEKVLLILDSEDTRRMLQEALAGYQVLYCKPEKAEETLTQFQPDALILDLFLPGIDGLTILEQCQELLPPVVLPLTLLVTDYILLKAAQLGAGFVISKPCSIDDIRKRLGDMLQIHQSTKLSDHGDLVDELLNRFGLHTKPRVFDLLHTAVVLSLRDPDCLLTKEIYPILCKKYGTTEDAVDQAIRRVLRKAWDRRADNPEVWIELFPGYKKCPTNGDFTLTLASYLRKKHPFRFERKH